MKWLFYIILASFLISSCDKKIHEVTVLGYFIDSRDSNLYSTVAIGTQTWMAENLAYLPQVDSLNVYSLIYPNFYLLEYSDDTLVQASEQLYYEEFGVLYNWMAALNSCPDGWHLPTDQEWITYESFLGMQDVELEKSGWRLSGSLEFALKSRYGWDRAANGNNVSGFNARPASYTNAPDDFAPVGGGAYFWTATTDVHTKLVWFRSLSAVENGVLRLQTERSRGMSVRCLRDEG